MKTVVEIVTGIFILIGIFLFLSHGTQTVRIIDTIAKNSIRGIQALQGQRVNV